MIDAEEERTTNEGWTAAQLNGKANEEIEKLYYNAYRRVHHHDWKDKCLEESPQHQGGSLIQETCGFAEESQV